MKKRAVIFIALFAAITVNAQQTQTFAERLGYPKGAKVLILHVDDAGMSHESDVGVEMALTQGVSTSTSVMMPCPWVPEIVKFVKDHPGTDAGLHLTLTSEWDVYRWGPLAGKTAVPGLVDKQGDLYSSVAGVYVNASPEEVDKEIRAQWDRALAMGFTPTHLDSHMGTLFAKEAYLQKYLQLGIEKHIPVMFPGGNDLFFRAEARAAKIVELKAQGKYKEGMEIPEDPALGKAKEVGEMLWKAGLPVLDDLHNSSYDWNMPNVDSQPDSAIQKWYTDHYIESFSRLGPGLTMVIMHCTYPSENFKYICREGNKRKGDLLAMIDPRLKAYLQKNGFILTTWREVMQRRQKIAGSN